MLKSTVVIGASLRPNRYSHRAVIRLSALGFPVQAVGLREGTIGDVQIQTFESAFAKIDDLVGKIDTLTLYLNPEQQKAYYDFFIKLKPKRIIFNPGTENPSLYAKLQNHGIKSEVACTLVLLATGQY